MPEDKGGLGEGGVCEKDVHSPTLPYMSLHKTVNLIKYLFMATEKLQ